VIFEAAVAMRDAATGMVRAGDVLCVRPYSWAWGLMEIRRYLILPIRSTKGPPAVQSLWENIFTGDILTMAELARIPVEGIRDGQFRLVAKSDHSLRITDIMAIMPDFDIISMLNSHRIYQPFKSASGLIRRFDGREGRHAVAASEVDTVSVVSPREADMIVDLARHPVIRKKGPYHAHVKKAAGKLQYQHL